MVDQMALKDMIDSALESFATRDLVSAWLGGHAEGNGA